MEKTSVTLQDIKEAMDRIRPYVIRTPILRQQNMDYLLGCQIHLKPEMLQVTGSFKPRGAFNKIFSLTPEEKKMGIVLTSSGNHAQACAFAGKMLGIHTTVIIPEDAPAIKAKNARDLGAEVILWNRNYTQRWEKVLELQAEHGYVIVPAYDDYAVMAGQGTIGLEILQDLPDVNTILVPISGGGLISGIATAIKESNPNIKIIGIQAAASCAYYVSRQNGYPSTVVSKPSVADGLNCSRTSEMPYPIIEKYVDEIAIVEEEDILEAVRLLADKAKLIAEPSACVGIAALLSGRINTSSEQKVCAVLSGGNWDIDMIGKILIGDVVKGI